MGGDLSATEHDQSCRWVQRGGIDVLDTPVVRKDGAFTDFLAKSSLVRKTASRTRNSRIMTMSVAEGAERD